MDFSDAVAEVLRCSGSHFDPQVVKAFLQVVAEQGPAFFEESVRPEFSRSYLDGSPQALLRD
jgi:HD-GYP domain-containing protein (c-di-GMP phosphodiesterase class II)